MSEVKPLVEREEIRIAMIGMSEGNGHPYSWSAMFNGYDREKMTAECPFRGIPEYLNKQPEETIRIGGARVTHLCCTGEAEFTAEHVAACSLIPNVVADPTAVIGEVDAVIVATDKGYEHVERCRPFIEAGLPLFVDKPMVDSAKDLAIFNRWHAEGRPFMSSSSMRYTKEFLPFHRSTYDLGALRFVSITTAKSWETYGIHALESIYPIVGPGFLSARNSGTRERNVVHFTHRKGIDVVAIASKDMYGAFGLLTLAGTHGSAQVAAHDSFYSFQTQLREFVGYLRSGRRPYPYAETEELMRMVIAGTRSREEGGTEVMLDRILDDEKERP